MCKCITHQLVSSFLTYQLMQGHHAVPRQQKSPTPPQKACLHLTRCRTPRPRPPRGGAAPLALCSSSITTDSLLQYYNRLTPLISLDSLLQSYNRLTPPVLQQAPSSSRVQPRLPPAGSEQSLRSCAGPISWDLDSAM